MVVVKNWVRCHEVGDIALTICVVVQRPKSFLVLIEGDANLLSAHTTHLMATINQYGMKISLESFPCGVHLNCSHGFLNTVSFCGYLLFFTKLLC